MNRQLLAVVAVIGVVVAGALAVAAGVGPFGGDEGALDDGTTGTPGPPTGDRGGTTTADGGGGADGGGADGAVQEPTATPTPGPPFATRIDSIDSCGQTCRDVTATLINRQDRPAADTTVNTRIHAGRGTDGDVVWEGSHEVGTLAAGASETETQRVQLSYFEAIEVQRRDGWVTIVTTIDTDRRTVTFREQRDVS